MKNALWVILILLSSSAAGTTYYIDPSGSNSNNGSSTSPWKTLAYACSKATASGDIIHINAGTYVETTQSSLAAGVNIVGDGNTSIIHSDITADNTFTLLLSSASQGTNGNQSISYIRMEGGMLAYGAILVDKRINVNIHHCEFEDFFTKGVTFSGAGYTSSAVPTTYATGNSFHDNIVTNCADYEGSGHTGVGYGNLELGGQRGMLVYNNTITQEDRGTDSNGYCIKYCSNGYCEGLKIYNNTIIKPPYDGSTWDFSMELWNCRGGIEIYGNNIQGSIDFGGNTSITNDAGAYGFAVKVHDNTIGQSALRTREEAGIDLERGHTGGIYIYNNLFQNLSTVLVMAQAGGDKFEDLYVYYNIFNNLGASGKSNFGNGTDWATIDTENVTYNNINFLNNTINAGTGGDPLAGLRLDFHGNVTNVTIRNNIIQGFLACPIYTQSKGTITTVSIENNIYYNNGSNAPQFDPNTPTNITNKNNLTSNPLFISATDFHLQSGSPAIGKGLVITGPTTDYDGNAIKNPPSIGSFEYASSAPPTDVPVYQSATVENTTPSVIDVTYSLTLANIVPATSVFNIQVNSVARNVSSISISGNKIHLTLASAIVYGDIVTLSYTKPVSNPLQTASGGQAASISAKSVTNNCLAPVPVYTSAAVENSTPAVIDVTYSLTLANIVPATSAFSIQVNSVARNASSVSISGNKIHLTLASAIVYGDIITLSYTKPASNPLQTTSGGQAASISAKSVTNNCLAPVPVYTSAAVENSTPAVIDVTYSLALANIVPATSAFNIQVNSVARNASSVSISGNKIHLTLASAIVYGDNITLSYTKPASNPLQTTSGGQAASISAKSVTNNCLATIPVYTSAAVENSTPAVIDVTYSLALANIIPATSAFNIQVNSVARNVSSVSISGTIIHLTLASAIVYGDIITLSYTKPASNPLQTTSGGQAASISAKSVTNNCLAAIPVYTSAAVENSTPAVIDVTYSQALANIVPATSAFNIQVNSVARNVSSVSISGTIIHVTLASAIVYGDIITLSYTKPASNPLQTTSGGQAASISAKSVTNNCLAAIPVYTSAAVENSTPAVIDVTYSQALANIVPATSAFNIQVNSVARNVSSVSISGTIIHLTLASAIVYGDIITLSYTKPASNPLQTTSGGQAASISSKSVTNNCLAAIPVYTSAVVENSTPSVIDVTYSLALANIVPATSAFNIQVNSVARNVSSVTISGNIIHLTLASALVFGDIITLSYTKPASNPLQTTSGGQAASINTKSVTNNCLAAIPVYTSAVVENSTPSVIDITYSLALANIVPATSAFNIQVNSVARYVTSVSISGNIIHLTLASTVVFGDLVTLSYTKPASNPLQTTLGAQAVSLSARSVTNNCLGSNPVYTSAVVENSTPSVIDVTYSLTLANIVPSTSAFNIQVNSVSRNVTSISISGNKIHLTLSSAIKYGDIIALSYTKPASNPLQTTAGGQAASINAKPVTNNCISNIPVYTSAAVENSTPSIVDVTYSLTLANIAPSTSAFNIQVNSVTRYVTSVSISGNIIHLTLSSSIKYGDIISLSYTKPASNPLQSTTGGQAASINAKPVTNKIISNIPALTKAVIENATPLIIDMTFSLTLANTVPSSSAFNIQVNSVVRNLTSVTVSGVRVKVTLESPVKFGDVITLSYTKPAVNPLQSSSGGQVASIHAISVTNNCISNIPVYTSAVVEDATPSIIDLTFSLPLANILPSGSAFNIQVNSVSRNVTSVSVSGTKVDLTVVNPVKFGDIITLSYSRPADNPLQSTTGEQVSDIGYIAVINNIIEVQKANNPPVVAINYPESMYGGFVTEIDASSTYDPNNDTLTAEWIIPDDIQISSTNSLKIEFLAPFVNVSRTVSFELKVSDGEAVSTTDFTINVLPYKPELAAVNISNVTGSDYLIPDYPVNAIDGNITTKWSSDGNDKWLLFTLDGPNKISYLVLAFLQGQNYESYFDILASKDNITWDKILTGKASCKFSGERQVFDIPALFSNMDYQYLKFVGYGNSVSLLNNVSEIRLFGTPQQNSNGNTGNKISVYPNPAKSFINILIDKPLLDLNLLRIVDISGKVVFEDTFVEGINNVQLPSNINPGVYLVEIRSGNAILGTQKLIVVK